MDANELHRLAFLFGYKSQEVNTSGEELLLLYKSISHFTGIVDIKFDESSITNYSFVPLELENTGQYSLSKMLYAGVFWYKLNIYVKWLLLQGTEAISSFSKWNHLEGVTFESLYGDLRSFFHNNVFHLPINYFFDAPLQDILTEAILSATEQIEANIENLERIDHEKLAEQLYFASSLVSNFIIQGKTKQKEKINRNIDQRTLFRSKTRVFLPVIPLLVFIPPLLSILFTWNASSGTQDGISSLTGLSGIFSVLGIALKFFYDFTVPKMQKYLLKSDLQKIRPGRISKELMMKEFFGRADEIAFYPLEKYFLTGRKIQSWKDYVKFGVQLQEV
ncbi:MAG: hypothetical protein ACFFD4_05300 [Candidatus Odinarchaeota archaeon]